MGQIEDVVLLTREIESLLDRLGATGRGLHEKLTTVENRLSAQTVKKMRWIATMRNKTMHEHNFQINDFQGFKSSCNDVIAELNAILTPKSSKSGCFIATAVYGCYDAPEVIVLRRLRDEILLKSFAGRLFVRFYYATGPAIASCLSHGSPVSRLVRSLLNRAVVRLKRVL